MQSQRICIPGAVSTSTRISRSTLLPTAANLRRGWARSVAAPYSSLKAKKCRTDTIGLLDTARSYRLGFEVDWEKNQDSRGKRKSNGGNFIAPTHFTEFQSMHTNQRSEGGAERSGARPKAELQRRRKQAQLNACDWASEGVRQRSENMKLKDFWRPWFW